MTRAYDQIEMALIGDLPVRLVGSHCGVSQLDEGIDRRLQSAGEKA